MASTPKRSYTRNTKYGLQHIVPAKHTVAKTMRKKQYEKYKTNTENLSRDSQKENERESREN